MRIGSGISAALAGLVLAGMAFQGGPCPQKGVPGKKLLCPKEDKIVEAKDAKGGKCVADEEKLVPITVCTAKSFSFSCHPNKEGAGAGKSWWGKPAVETVSEVRVTSTCEGCSAKANAAKDVKHAEDCKKKKVVTKCEH